jgi:hypothetical protein
VDALHEGQDDDRGDIDASGLFQSLEACGVAVKVQTLKKIIIIILKQNKASSPQSHAKTRNGRRKKYSSKADLERS